MGHRCLKEHDSVLLCTVCGAVLYLFWKCLADVLPLDFKCPCLTACPPKQMFGFCQYNAFSTVWLVVLTLDPGDETWACDAQE